jgi:hypothetical protein
MLRQRHQYRLLTIGFLFALIGIAFFAGGLGTRLSLVQDQLGNYQFTNNKNESDMPQNSEPKGFWERFTTDPLVIVTSPLARHRDFCFGVLYLSSLSSH